LGEIGDKGGNKRWLSAPSPCGGVVGVFSLVLACSFAPLCLSRPLSLFWREAGMDWVRRRGRRRRGGARTRVFASGGRALVGGVGWVGGWGGQAEKTKRARLVYKFYMRTGPLRNKQGKASNPQRDTFSQVLFGALDLDISFRFRLCLCSFPFSLSLFLYIIRPNAHTHSHSNTFETIHTYGGFHQEFSIVLFISLLRLSAHRTPHTPLHPTTLSRSLSLALPKQPPTPAAPRTQQIIRRRCR
jgi:hypothetical protein